MKNVRISFVYLLFLIFAAISVSGQSTNVEFPTPITSDTVNGRIKARDIGDPRSTVYYYVFEAKQGDVFIKVESFNLNGDVDVFYADNLRPVTKITLYADSTPTQTARELYFRKPEKLILRVEGRTPSDDPATFKIKFEGSFQAMASTKVPDGQLPVVKEEAESEIKVNSVGTIIEVKPKATPTPKETIAKNSKSDNSKTTTTPEPISTIKLPKTTANKPKTKVETETPTEKKTAVVPNKTPKKTETKKVEPAKESESVKEEVEKIAEEPKTTKKTVASNKNNSTAKKTTTAKKEPPPAKPSKAEELEKALENVRLVVDFKDGGRIERPMNDVIRFGVDKGFLTIVHKDGSIGRYSILEISKISVE